MTWLGHKRVFPVWYLYYLYPPDINPQHTPKYESALYFPMPSVWLHFYGTMIYKRYVFDLHAISGTELLKILEFHIRGVSYKDVFYYANEMISGPHFRFVVRRINYVIEGLEFSVPLHWLLRREERLEVELIPNGQWFNQPWQCNYTLMCVSHSVQLFATPWTIARQTPLSTGLCRQVYWSGLPFPSPVDLPNTGIKPWSPALQADKMQKDRVWRVPRSMDMGKFRKSGISREHGSFSPHPFLILCPMYLFHLDVSELCPFVINQ